MTVPTRERQQISTVSSIAAVAGTAFVVLNAGELVSTMALVVRIAGVVTGVVFDRPWLWVAIVVGVHFFGLGALRKAPTLHALGAGMTVLGVLGLLPGLGDDGALLAAVVAGLGSAVLLFAFAA